MKISKRFFENLKEDCVKIILEDLLTILFDKFFSKLIIETKTRRSFVDLKKILFEDLSKISKRFGPKIFQKCLKDLN
jgi:hypothetical protein